jgi:hypothetical protein
MWIIQLYMVELLKHSESFLNPPRFLYIIILYIKIWEGSNNFYYALVLLQVLSNNIQNGKLLLL